MSKSRRRSEANSVRVPEVKAQSNSSSSLPGLHFRRSTYGWKVNLIRKPIQVVSRQKPFVIDGNRRNKSASRICQGTATPSFGPLDRVSCLDPLGAHPGG